MPVRGMRRRQPNLIRRFCQLRAGFLPLFLASFLALYFELIVIRYLSTEIRVFAYLKNLALIASFFGIGLGMVIGKPPRPSSGSSRGLPRFSFFSSPSRLLLGLTPCRFRLRLPGLRGTGPGSLSRHLAFPLAHRDDPPLPRPYSRHHVPDCRILSVLGGLVGERLQPSISSGIRNQPGGKSRRHSGLHGASPSWARLRSSGFCSGSWL